LSVPATTPLSYNGYVTHLGIMAVVMTTEIDGVVQGVDPAFTNIIPNMLNYAELRIQRDLDLLNSQTTNTYTLTAGNPILPIPINDFLTLQTFEVTQTNGSQTVNATPLLPVSKEFIQNCFAGLANAGTPRYFAMVGDNFGDGADSFNNVLLGPLPNFPYTVRVTGTIRTPSLFTYAAPGVADTSFTYISQFYPDMLIMASMIYISAFQRNFGPTSDTPESGMTYEKQYQALRLGAIAEENRKKFQGSGWSSYSTPTSATPTR
jgi:hypothetical protein